MFRTKADATSLVQQVGTNFVQHFSTFMVRTPSTPGCRRHCASGRDAPRAARLDNHPAAGLGALLTKQIPAPPNGHYLSQNPTLRTVMPLMQRVSTIAVPQVWRPSYFPWGKECSHGDTFEDRGSRGSGLAQQISSEKAPDPERRSAGRWVHRSKPLLQSEGVDTLSDKSDCVDGKSAQKSAKADPT